MENLQALALRSEKFTASLRFNYDRTNYKKCPDFLDMIVQRLHRDPRFRIRFKAVTKMGGANDANLDVCGLDEMGDIERTMKREAAMRGLALSDDITSISGVGAHVCYAARPYNFLVGATGKLMKCTVDLDKNDRNVVGRITADGELVIDQDKLALWTEPAFQHDGKCQKCVILPVCQGMICPIVRFDTGKSPCPPLRHSAKRDILELAERPRTPEMVSGPSQP